MPVRILPSLIKSERNNFNFKIFKKKFDEILLISNYRIKIRCLRLIQQAIITNIDKKDISYAPYYMDLGINEMKKIIDNPAYSRGYKYSLHALIDMSIKYLNISKKNMEMNEAQYIQEKIIAIPKKEMDSYILSGIKQYISYCQDHGCEEICAPIIIRHYEDIPILPL